MRKQERNFFIRPFTPSIMICVILVEPKNSGNIGAISRAMKNFGFTDLVLVRPHCNPLAQPAMDRASHAFDVLEKAKTMQTIPPLDCLVATTGKLGTDYNLKRSPLSPKELAHKLTPLCKSRKKIGIVFGPEDHGLTNKELTQCDFTVTINSSKRYPILNLSHAVAIILYELADHTRQKKINTITPIGKKDKEELLKLIHHTLDSMSFTTPNKKETQKQLWKRVVGKALLTKREFTALMGYFKKVSEQKASS